MGLAINTNVTSMKSQRHLMNNTNKLNTSFERLSSGLRINSAQDDAAGMNITTKLTSQVRGLNQAARNVTDSGSLLKTAESALSETNNLLQRMRELAVQASNDTNTAADRQALQAEADQLISEIDRIANQVQYNGQLLLDGTFQSKTFQVGANAGQTLTVGINAARSTDIGNSHSFTSAADTNASTATTGAAGTFGANQGTDGYVDDQALSAAMIKVGGANGQTVNVGATAITDDTLSTAGKDTSAIAKAAAINRVSAQTGVVAEATETHWVAEATAIIGDGTNAVGDGDITINDISITFAGGSALVLAADSDQTLADAINAKTAQTGVTADTTSGTLNLKAADGRNINVVIAGANTATNLGSAEASTTARGGLSFSSTDTSGQFRVNAQSGTADMVSIGMGTGLAGGGGTTASSNLSSGDEVSALQLGAPASAGEAIGSLDTAIAQIASSRSALGALLNRLDSSANTLKISAENMSAARSEIQDVDFAKETAEFSKNQILQQASSSMLTQANTSGQIALSLLGFG